MYNTDSPELTPTPEHEWLASFTGQWNIDCEYFYGDDEPALTTTATNKARMFGSFWLVEEITIDMLAGPIEVIASTTFSPLHRTFISRWVDSSMPYPYRFEGRFNRNENLLVLGGTNYDPVHQIESHYTSVTEISGKTAVDSRITTLKVQSPDGLKTPVLRYRYERVN